jgi:2-iminobutanoate/2-iminopropanoate deaminase
MRRLLATPSIGAPAAPYSMAIEANGLVFIAGQVGVDAATNALVGDDIADQTRQCLRNLGIVLHDIGLDYTDVAKTTVYITDFAEFDAMNQVYREFFVSEPPARATIAVRSLAPGFKVEIEAVAAVR